MLKYTLRKAIAALCLAASFSTFGASIDVGVSREGWSYAMITGEITEGDGARFRQVINLWKKQRNMPQMVFLNSPGGDVYEGYALMNTVLDYKLRTFVIDDAQCASACVAVFAAGSYRYADPGSHIGVHRAAVMGSDNDYARSASVSMVKVYKYLGIPDSVRLKMIDTDPDKIYWLTKREKDELSTNTADFANIRETVRTDNVPTRTITVVPTDRQQARELNEQGIQYINRKNYDYAVRVLSVAKDLSPTDAEILGNLGYAFYMTGRYSDAQVMLTASLNLKPKRGSSWNNLGLVMSALGDESWATDCFINYWQFSKNKNAATNQFFYWEAQRPGTVLDRASKQARARLGIYSPAP